MPLKNFRFSLFTKVILWFFLNVIVLAAIVSLFFLYNSRIPANSAFSVFSVNRMREVTRLIEEETHEKTRAERDEILKKYGDYYGLRFYIFDYLGNQIAGEKVELPKTVYDEITRPEVPWSIPEKSGEKIHSTGGRPPHQHFLTTDNPKLYWGIYRIVTVENGEEIPLRTRLLADSKSFFGGGLFFNPIPWICVFGIVVGVSVLMWFPFVRKISRKLSEMTVVTEKIANEDFEVRVDEQRKDELGRLGKAINQMTVRLAGFVYGQKRFLGDVSHELNSPLARMQVALSILEERVDNKNLEYVKDVKEEVELMSKLVGELLEFSRTGIKNPNIKLEKQRLLPIIQEVVQREADGRNNGIKIEVDEKLEVTAQAGLLSRAVANVVRNAVRYAGDKGEILIRAEKANNRIKLTVSDEGEGVSETFLDRIFEPFYRIEEHRSRETGGSGLGLAIVKTCIENCEGEVSAENLRPNGFAVNMFLKH